MAEIAGVGPAVLLALRDGGRGNLVAAHAAQQAVGRVRHMAVVATAALGLGGVMRVRRDLRFHFRVALEAAEIGGHARFELAVGPRFHPGGVQIFRMHFVARQTGELSALVARRRESAVHLAPRNPDHPVAPEAVADEMRVGLADHLLLLGMIGRVRLEHEALLQVRLARAKGHALAVPRDLVGHAVERPDAVALAASERSLASFHALGVGDGGVALVAEVARVTAQRIAVLRDMLGALAVARLAGDAELAHLRIKLVALDEARAALRDVAIHAAAVPRADGVEINRVGRQHKGLQDRGPDFFLHQIGERKLHDRPPLAGLQPEHFLVMGTGQQHDLLRLEPVAPGTGLRTTARVVTTVAQLHAVIPTVERALEAVHRRRDVRRVGDLRHRAVIRVVPARVVARMARAAGVGRHVARAEHLDRAIRRRGGIFGESHLGNQRRARSEQQARDARPCRSRPEFPQDSHGV